MEAVIFVMHLVVSTAFAAEAPPAKIKYKAAKELDFEQVLVEGSLKRPELAVITGDSDENGNGLLRLREDFKDRTAQASGEDVQ
jgi:hypothetical protein